MREFVPKDGTTSAVKSHQSSSRRNNPDLLFLVSPLCTGLLIFGLPNGKITKEMTMDELLPLSFGPESLGINSKL